MKLCKNYHDSPVAGHPGRSKTFSLLARDYYWSRYHQFVARYVQHCHVCSRSKPSHHAKYGVLKPLSIPEQRWKDISMDFISGLPESDNKDTVLSVVCRLTKMKHFISCKETTDARTLAKLYVENVWKPHGLPDSIVSDRGGQFVADFWKALCERLKINSRLSTSFHPETDGQTERYNSVMEQYLRSYVSYQQDDWTDWLPMAEFASNNADSETTSVSPFLANYGFHPRLGFEPIQRESPNAQVLSADEFANKMKDISEHLGNEMRLAQARYEDSANANRLPAPMFQVGDEVWLDARHIKTKRPSRKLDWKKLGRFTIKRVISKYAYELNLPASMKIHPVFHVSLLEPVSQHPHVDQVPAPSPPVEVEGEEEWEVEDIMDSRFFRRRLQYLVKWAGWDSPDWTEAKDVTHCDDLVKDYHRLRPNKPGSPRGART